MIKKVVPILIRRKAQTLEILAFRHPLAGIQLVKGSIEPNETYDYAAIRELFEESGLIA
uniref:NUDIX domain-containing protein n=1 Tax=Acinetobacter ursingii TaxID=108980 RepID=UPI00124C1F65